MTPEQHEAAVLDFDKATDIATFREWVGAKRAAQVAHGALGPAEKAVKSLIPTEFRGAVTLRGWLTVATVGARAASLSLPKAAIPKLCAQCSELVQHSEPSRIISMIGDVDIPATLRRRKAAE